MKKICRTASSFSRLMSFSAIIDWLLGLDWGSIEYIRMSTCTIHSSTCGTHTLPRHGAVHRQQAHVREVCAVYTGCMHGWREWTVMLWDGRLDILQGGLSSGCGGGRRLVAVWRRSQQADRGKESLPVDEKSDIKRRGHCLRWIGRSRDEASWLRLFYRERLLRCRQEGSWLMLMQVLVDGYRESISRGNYCCWQRKALGQIDDNCGTE